MNCHQGYVLNVQSIKNVTVNTTDECIVECIDTVNCTSLNAETVIGGTTVRCSILSTDRHRESGKFITESSTEHCSIMVNFKVSANVTIEYTTSFHDLYFKLMAKCCIPFCRKFSPLSKILGRFFD